MFREIFFTGGLFLTLFFINELLLFVKEKKGTIREVVLGIIIGLIFAWLLHYNIHDFLKDEKPILSIKVSIISMSMPIFLIIAGNQFLSKLRNKIYKHLSIVAFAFINSVILIFWILYVSCEMGLDCI